jgi:dienelactone hydrolase
MESTVSFKSGETELRGILHTPDRERREVGVVLLCPGYKHRVGQNRLYIRIARNLSTEGYYVLRFDFHGLGESEGEIERCMFGEFWRFVQTGGFVSDTLAAVDFLKTKTDVSRVVLMGLCGGAITGLIAGAREPRVDGLVLMNVPVMLESASGDWFEEKMPPGFADLLVSGYMKKVVSLQSWMRFLSFKTDYRLIWKSISSRVRRKLGRFRSRDSGSYEADGRISPYFFKSFQSYCASQRPLLLVFSGNDMYRWAFEADFEERFLQDGNPFGDSYSIFVVDGANHGFTKAEWLRALLNRTVEWIRQNFVLDSPRRRAELKKTEVSGGEGGAKKR